MLTRKGRGQRAEGIDYSLFKWSKGPRLDVQRKRKRNRTRRHRQSVKQKVFIRDQQTCRAFGVSPICTRRAADRHEVVSLGRGGKVTMENCLASCRADHDATHGEPGVSVRLVYDWPGKADGVPPDCNVLGLVRPVWKGTR